MRRRLRILTLMLAIGLFGLLAVRSLAPQMAAPIPPAIPITPAVMQREVITPENVKYLQEVRSITHPEMLRDELEEIYNIPNETLYSHDSRWLLTVPQPRDKILIFDVETGDLIYTIQPFIQIAGLQITLDSRWLKFTMIEANDIHTVIWDLSAQKMVGRFKSWERGFAFSVQGQIAERIGDTSFLRIWDLNTAASHILGVTNNDFMFSPDGSRLIGDNTVWDTGTWEVVATLPAQESMSFSLIPSPDNIHILAYDSYGYGNRMYNTMTDSSLVLEVSPPESGTMLLLVFAPDGQKIVMLSYDYSCKVYDVKTLQPVLSVEACMPGFGFNDQIFVKISPEQKFDFINIATGQTLPLNQTITYSHSTAHRVLFSPDSRTMSVSTDDGTLHVYAVVRS